MDRDFTPTGSTEPETLPDAALLWLRDAMHVDFTASYHAPSDHRHELSVAAVDLTRRMLDLSKALLHAADTEAITLQRIRDVRWGDLAEDEGTALAPMTVPLRARIAELHRTLRVLTVAYKQAWFNGAVPAPPQGQSV